MKARPYRIILVEDDTSLGYLLTEYLKIKGFEITWAKNGRKAMEEMGTNAFDLAVLDVMMPDMDGFTLASKIQSDFQALPFIFLTAKSLKIVVLKGFSLGAVDYLKKPIDEEELVIRIETLLSRLTAINKEKEQEKIFSLGTYSFNSLNHELIRNGKTIHLTSRENELLKLLASNKNQLCSHKDILLKIWGRNDYFNKKSLNVFITRLRKYFEKDVALKIENVHGQGFILRVGEEVI
jgi:DNA-binding response OmpR family regulator